MKKLSRNEIVAEYDFLICDLCKRNGYLDNLPLCSTCEGSFCREAEDDFAEENDIEIID